jgi:hypothetical protein
VPQDLAIEALKLFHQQPGYLNSEAPSIRTHCLRRWRRRTTTAEEAGVRTMLRMLPRELEGPGEEVEADIVVAGMRAPRHRSHRARHKKIGVYGVVVEGWGFLFLTLLFEGPCRGAGHEPGLPSRP